jgi:mRNA interferase RelE/StbE
MPGGDNYRVHITQHARRSLRSLKRNQRFLKRILNAIGELGTNPRPPGYKKLKGSKFENLHRIRVGDWRILYAIEEDVLVLIILDVVRRDQAYR